MQDYSEDDAEAWSPWRSREALAALCRAMSIGALIGAAGAAVWQLTAARLRGTLQHAP